MPDSRNLKKLAHGLMLALILASIALSPARVLADEIDDVCNGVSPGAGTQKSSYCDAARKAAKSASTDGALWKLWAGVATVCTTACVMSGSVMGIASNQYVCMGTNLAATVTDAMMTKQYMSAMMGVGSSAMGYMMNENSNEKIREANEAAGPGKQKVEKDWGACFTAATATLQSFMKHQTAKASEDSVSENLAAARKLDSDAVEINNRNTAATMGNEGGGGGSMAGTYRQAAVTDYAQGSSASAGTCSPGQANVRCAVAADGTLPRFVNDPKFAEELKKSTGMPLNDYLNSSGGTPAAAIGGGIAGTLGDKSTGIIATLKKFEQNFGDVEGSAYAMGGGGGGGRGGRDDGGDPSQMLAGFMEKLMPKSGEEGQATGISAVAFANRTRSPASLAEDRSLSLFDRVTYRYLVVSNKLFTTTKGQMP